MAETNATLGEKLAALTALFAAQDEYICKTLERIEKKLDDHVAGSRADKDTHHKEHENVSERLTIAEGQIATGKRLLGGIGTIAVSALGAALKNLLGI